MSSVVRLGFFGDARLEKRGSGFWIRWRRKVASAFAAFRMGLARKSLALDALWLIHE
jgi:hypothetical protein